jgi:ABC-type transport system involved in cytochrome c biogenesis ATPase subunit
MSEEEKISIPKSTLLKIIESLMQADQQIQFSTMILNQKAYEHDHEKEVWMAENMTIEKTIQALTKVGYNQSTTHNDNCSQSICQKAVEYLKELQHLKSKSE